MEKLWGIILTTSYQATIVGIIIILAKTILKNKLSPKWNYLIWMILIIKLIIPFGPESNISIFNKIPQKTNTQIVSNNENTNYNINYEGNKEKNIKENTNYINESQNTKSLENTHIQQTDTKQKNKLTNYIPYIWAIVATNILAFTLVVYTILNLKLRKNNIIVSNDIQNILNRTKEKINTGHKVNVVINEYISTPALSGILRPKILIPSNMVNLKEKELEYIFLHELAHYKRKDILTNYILLFLQSMHWFNPIIWYLFKKIREDIEFATDEKVLKIIEEKEHKEYAKSILTVLEKVNVSLFYPRLISMANDKEKVQKRIIKIKEMKFTKKKQLMFTIIGLLAILIIAPIALTSASKEEETNKDIAKKELTKLQKSYINILSNKENGQSITYEKLKEIIPDIKPVEQDGYVDTGYIEYTNEDLRAVEFKQNKEKISVTYRYEQNQAKEAKVVHYLDKKQNGYLNGVHAMYNVEEEAMIDKFRTIVGSVSVEDQKKLIQNLDKSTSKKEVYQMYYKFAEMTQQSIKLTQEEIDNVLKGINYDIDGNQIFIHKDGCILALIYNKESEAIYGVKLIDHSNGFLLYTKSEIGKSISVQYGNKNNVAETIITNHTIEEQRKLLLKINENIQRSSPVTDKKEVDKKTLEQVKENNKLFGMTIMKDISYSSEINPKDLSMKDSIEYVKKNTRKDIKEVDRTYESEVGVTEVTYKADNKKYIVRYMHPYKSGGNNVDEYDIDKTLGIWVYEN